VISAYPDRASEKGPEPKREDENKKTDEKSKKEPASTDSKPAPPPAPIKPLPALVDALTSAFDVQRPPDATEVAAALMGAAAALQLLSFKPRIEGFCKSDNPSLREHAEKALRVLGDKKKTCQPEGPGKPPPELERPPPERTTLAFETDGGEVRLTLESALAPVATARFLDLAKSGFFENVVIHRVVPGFVVQLGDPGGDGYGGAGKEPLRCETSPVSFEPLSVGVALAGRDTGSSQLFVTLGPFPHLDGDYALIGKADPGWDRIAQGDVVKKVRVLP
jgi:cyclophilin family peptidyl-prolyl cis-trans isomerase